MRLTRLLLPPVCAAWLFLTAATAGAAPPVNDNYLSSLQMVRANGVARTFRSAVDTTEATTQADLFDPNRDGIPFGGAGPEDTNCGGVEYGKTVWYDFAPEVFGGVQILAAGYDTVVRVYEYDPQTSLITRTVVCQNDSADPAEDVILRPVSAGHAYTVQVGGVGAAAAAASGKLDFRFFFFADRDRDEILDAAPDRCPTQPGIAAAGGCPPALNPNPRLSFQNVPNGIRVTRLEVEQLPPGARVEARCRKCGLKQSRTVRGGSVKLDGFVGKDLPANASLELFATRPRTQSGRYRYGAIGTYIRYDIKAGSLGRRTVECLPPGSLTPKQRCT
jgi:hypothetical protein